MRWLITENDRVEKTIFNSETFSDMEMLASLSPLQRMLEEDNEIAVLRDREGNTNRELKQRDALSVCFKSNKGEYQTLLERLERKLKRIENVGRKDKDAIRREAARHGFNVERRVDEALRGLREEYKAVKAAIDWIKENKELLRELKLEEMNAETYDEVDYDLDEEMWNETDSRSTQAEFEPVYATETRGYYDEEEDEYVTYKVEVDVGYYFPAPYLHARMPRVYKWYAKRIEAGLIDSPKWLFEKLMATKAKYNIDDATHRKWSKRLWTLFHSKAYRTNPKWYRAWTARKKAYKMKQLNGRNKNRR